MSEEQRYVFAAYCEHGKVHAASVDDMPTNMACAADVAGYKKWASKVERLPLPLKPEQWKCEPCEEKRKRRRKK